MTVQQKAALAGAAETITLVGEIITEVRKNQREVYRVTRREFKGYDLADVRVWYDDTTTRELRPGKGVNSKVEVLAEIVKVPAVLLEGASPARGWRHDERP
jgi:hypothetical protein